MLTSWLTFVATLAPTGSQRDPKTPAETATAWFSALLWVLAAIGMIGLMTIGFAVYLSAGGTIGPGAPPAGF